MAILLQWDPPLGTAKPVKNPDEGKRIIQSLHPAVEFGEWEAELAQAGFFIHRIRAWHDQVARQAAVKEIAWILDIP